MYYLFISKSIIYFVQSLPKNIPALEIEWWPVTKIIFHTMNDIMGSTVCTLYSMS